MCRRESGEVGVYTGEERKNEGQSKLYRLHMCERDEGGWKDGDEESEDEFKYPWSMNQNGQVEGAVVFSYFQTEQKGQHRYIKNIYISFVLYSVLTLPGGHGPHFLNHCTT